MPDVMTRRSFGRIIFGGAAICLVRPALASSDPLAEIKAFFKGGVVGKGKYISTVDSKPPRGMVMTLAGIEDGDRFRLRQEVVFSDGAKDSNVWTFRRVKPEEYIGERTRVEGEVPVAMEGSNRIRLDYTAPVPTEDGKWMTVRFHDHLAKVSPTRAEVRTEVSYFGVTVGHGELTFLR